MSRRSHAGEPPQQAPRDGPSAPRDQERAGRSTKGTGYATKMAPAHRRCRSARHRGPPGDRQYGRPAHRRPPRRSRARGRTRPPWRSCSSASTSPTARWTWCRCARAMARHAWAGMSISAPARRRRRMAGLPVGNSGTTAASRCPPMGCTRSRCRRRRPSRPGCGRSGGSSARHRRAGDRSASRRRRTTDRQHGAPSVAANGDFPASEWSAVGRSTHRFAANAGGEDLPHRARVRAAGDRVVRRAVGGVAQRAAFTAPATRAARSCKRSSSSGIRA